MNNNEIIVMKSVDAGVEAVWSALTDVERLADVFESVVAVEKLTPGQLSVGTEWRETYRWLSFELASTVRVARIEDGRVLEIRSNSAGTDLAMEYRLEPRESETLVRMRFWAENHTWLARLIWLVNGPVVMQASRKNLPAKADELAGYVERVSGDSSL
ncbi:SRPBCC family protein [Nocardia abscessus]|uniref:SRPBCC family protein n=1 Tax=Nocardia abscessus TaxID=120957 RepID=UPI0024548192|nr:SRPBCC family protein [Nocardia abscessus]